MNRGVTTVKFILINPLHSRISGKLDTISVGTRRIHKAILDSVHSSYGTNTNFRTQTTAYFSFTAHWCLYKIYGAHFCIEAAIAT